MQVMMPNSAKSLKESKNNRIEDFVAARAPITGRERVLCLIASRWLSKAYCALGPVRKAEVLV